MTGLLKHRWLPVIVLPPILLLDGWLGEVGHLSPFSPFVAVIACLPLLLQRRLGFLGMAPLLTGGVVLCLVDFEPGTTVVAIPAWALFELTRDRGRQEAIRAATAVIPCVAVSVAPFCDDGAEFLSIFLRNVAICELAILTGYVLWRDRVIVERDADQRLAAERLRIAREVHDVVAHAMVAINVQSGVAAHLLDQDTEQAREALLHIKRTSGDALADLRATLGVLRDPHAAAPVGPAAGLDHLDGVADQLRANGVDVTVDVDTVDGVPTPVGAASYRIVQEALTNVLRHASASAASVVVRADEDLLTVVVADDGTGRSTSTAGAGAGVRGMRERAEALGGTLEAGPGAAGGWQVEAALPLVSRAAV